MEIKCLPMDEWIKKCGIYIQIHTVEYYSSIEKNEISLFATTWIDLEGIMLSEISQRQIPNAFTYMWNLKDKNKNLIEIDQISSVDQFSSVEFSRSVVSDSLRPHEPQHTRPPCPSPTPRVYSNSCPSSW